VNLPLMKTNGLSAQAPTQTAAYRTRLRLPKKADLLPPPTLAFAALADLAAAQTQSGEMELHTKFKAEPNVHAQPPSPAKLARVGWSKRLCSIYRLARSNSLRFFISSSRSCAARLTSALNDSSGSLRIPSHWSRV
jgi:hypothetical protein